MDNLDFSALTDDQLIALIRGALREAVCRSPAVRSAARAAVLDEADKAKIAAEAAEREAAAQRARQRQAVAEGAAEQVRREHAAQAAAAEKQRAVERARAEAAEAMAREESYRQYLRRAACLVDLPPEKICLVVYNGSVYVNEGSDRYAREHLVRYVASERRIETRRALIGRKPALIELCAELREMLRGGGAIIGSDFDFSTERPAEPAGASS